MLFYKNLTHLTLGMAILFFIITTLQLIKIKKRNRLQNLLLIEMIFWLLLEIKDSYILFFDYRISYKWENVLMSIDMWCIPMCWMFLFEIISPQWITLRKLLIIIIPYWLSTVLLLFYPSNLLFQYLLIFSLVVGIIAIVIVFLTSSKYDNYIKKSFSYLENIGVEKIRPIVLALFFCLLTWVVVNWQASWFGDAFYYLISIIVWVAIYTFLVNHEVTDVPDFLFPFANRQDQANRQSHSSEAEIAYDFAERLHNYMKEQSLYLNPKLTITDIAQEIHTNRTYLSDYLNNHLHTTFYDYVNNFRIHMACELLH